MALQGNTGFVARRADVVDVTLSLDTSAYADNDVLAAPQEVTGFFRRPGGIVTLQSLILLDKDAQAQDIDLLFMNATGSIGNENAAFAPTDAVADTIIGRIELVIADYMAISSTSHLICKRDLGLMMKAAAGATSLYIAAVCRSGTPTYTAAGITLKLGLVQD